MCDDFKCGPVEVQKGPPDCLPGWFNCGGGAGSNYPAPPGVQILPITVGGRNGKAVKKNKFKCGTCGEKPKTKPNIRGDCPMAKPRTVLNCGGGKPTGFVAKLKSLFGLK